MPKKYTKKESIIYWIIGLAIVFGSPYLFVSILKLGLAFPPLGIVLNGLLWFIFVAVIVSGIYETYKWIKLNRAIKNEQKQVIEEAQILDEIMEKDKKKKEQQDQQQQ